MKVIDLYPSGIHNTKPIGSLDITDVYKLIKEDKVLEVKTYTYRQYKELDIKAQFKKTNFTFVTFSGQFEGRSDKGIIQYSQFICIDIDNISEDERLRAYQFAINDPYTILAFTSPSMGFKIVIRNDNVSNHQQIFDAYRKYASKIMGIDLDKFDTSGRNLSRACFLCHDRNVYINSLALENKMERLPVINHLLHQDKVPTISIIEGSNNVESKNSLVGYSLDFDNKNTETNFRKLVSIAEGKYGKYQSPREPWIQKLACLCNAFGMVEEITLKYTLEYFSSHPESTREDKPIDLNSYIEAPVKDTYKRYAIDFGSWENNEIEEKYVTPTIPKSVFRNCPPFIKNLVALYDNPRDRDGALLAIICVLSSCFPEVYGIYDQKYVNANLFLFITAPASAGKGHIASVRFLGHRLQEEHNEIFKQMLQVYENEMAQYQEGDKKGPQPIRPKRKMFFIPANNSSSKILDQLSVNKNFGIIMDTEADTLAQALKTDWGNFSDILRKVFHHEALEMQRKIGDEYISMQRTNLSILLTGTPNQVNNLIKSVENGAFSRFMFYDFPMSSGWKDVFKSSGDNLPEFAFKDMGSVLFQFMERLKQVPKRDNLEEDFAVEVRMTDIQKEKFNDFFSTQRALIASIHGEGMLSSLHRLGLIGFRIIMVLSIVDQFEQNTIPATILCKDNHFEIMLDLIECLTHHTAKIYSSLINQKKTSSKGNKRQKYYNSLPQEFSWAEAKQIAGLQTMTDKKAEYSVKKFIEEGILERLEHGSYTKI